MIGIIHANDTYAIDFENEIINPKDRVVYTGQGYFSVYYDGKAHNASAWEVTYSKDKVNWRNAVTDSNYEFLDSLVSSSNRLHKLLKRMMDIWLGEKIVYVMVLIM